MSYVFRLATLADIPAMKEIRENVRENPLVTTKIGERDYRRAQTQDGRAWVATTANGEVVGFACGRHVQRDIWALFVREDHERRGVGRELLARAVTWLFDQGLDSIQLTTAPGTRADRVYRRGGWVDEGRSWSGEVMFRLTLARWREDAHVHPRLDADARRRARSGWHDAVARLRSRDD